MSLTRLTVRRCSNVMEAESVRIRLEAEGIDAVVLGGETVVTLSYVGGAIGYPHVDVPAEDYQRAIEVLQADQDTLAIAQPWICSRFGEGNEASFDLCWSCNKSRDSADAVGTIDGEDRASEASDDSEAEPQYIVQTEPRRVADSSNPYRPLDWQTEVRQTTSERTERKAGRRPMLAGDDHVSRALRAAIIGFICPYTFMTLYSSYLLLWPPADGEQMSERHGAKQVIAWTLNGATVGVVAAFLSFAAVSS
jgi:hypothetical protein